MANFKKYDQQHQAYLPPQEIGAEEAVLGAIMLEKQALSIISKFLDPDMFYKDEHKAIFQSILNLDKKGKPIDIITVTKQAREDGKIEEIGGPYVISQLTDKVGSSANIETHAMVIVEKWMLRSYINLGHEMERMSYEGTADPFKISEHVDQKQLAIQKWLSGKNYKPLGDILPQAIKNIEVVAENENKLLGTPSGNVELDRCMHGFVKKRLVIGAGRPSMGKTSKMLDWALKMAIEFQTPVGIASLEMGSEELTYKMISARTGINGNRIINGDLSDHEWETINRELSILEQAPIYVDDTPGMTMFQIRNVARIMQKLYGIEIFMMDYAQIAGQSRDRMETKDHVSEVSQKSKGIAKELDICFVLFSQLSRAVETRGGDFKPRLSDLRESGSLEQDADQVIFFYRAEYYGFTEDEEGKPTEGVFEMLLRKNRLGNLGTIREWVDLGTNNFASIAENEQSPF